MFFCLMQNSLWQMISIGFAGGCVLISFSFLAQLYWPRLFKPTQSPKEHYTITMSDIDYSPQQSLEAAEVRPQLNFHFYNASHHSGKKKKKDLQVRCCFFFFSFILLLLLFWRYTISSSSEGFILGIILVNFVEPVIFFWIHMRIFILARIKC